MHRKLHVHVSRRDQLDWIGCGMPPRRSWRLPVPASGKSAECLRRYDYYAMRKRANYSSSRDYDYPESLCPLHLHHINLDNYQYDECLR